jgi:hypothetical protein
VAYKIGQIAILDMKKKAREQTGASFDIKAFHRCSHCPALCFGPTVTVIAWFTDWFWKAARCL